MDVLLVFCCVILILLCLLPGLHSYTYVCLLPVVSGLFDELGCSVRSYYIFNKTVDIYCTALSPLVHLQVFTKSCDFITSHSTG